MSQQQFDSNEIFVNVGYNDVMSFQKQPNTSRYSEMNETYDSSHESSTFDEGASELNSSAMATSGGQANMINNNIQTPPDTPADQRLTSEQQQQQQQQHQQQQQQQQQAALSAFYGNMYNYNAMAYMASGQPFYDQLSQYQQYINPQYQQPYQQFVTIGADGQQYAYYPTPEQLQQYYAQQYREQEQAAAGPSTIVLPANDMSPPSYAPSMSSPPPLHHPIEASKIEIMQSEDIKPRRRPYRKSAQRAEEQRRAAEARADEEDSLTGDGGMSTTTTNNDGVYRFNSKPEMYKDERYYERRKRNNEAAKKSRDSRKQREDEVLQRCTFLESENAIMRRQLAELQKEAETLRAMLKGGGRPGQKMEVEMKQHAKTNNCMTTTLPLTPPTFPLPTGLIQSNGSFNIVGKVNQ